MCARARACACVYALFIFIDWPPTVFQPAYRPGSQAQTHLLPTRTASVDIFRIFARPRSRSRSHYLSHCPTLVPTSVLCIFFTLSTIYQLKLTDRVRSEKIHLFNAPLIELTLSAKQNQSLSIHICIYTYIYIRRRFRFPTHFPCVGIKVSLYCCCCLLLW